MSQTATPLHLLWGALAMGLKMRPASDRVPQPPDAVQTLWFVFIASSSLHISHSVEGGLLTPQTLNSGAHLLKEPSQKGVAPLYVASWLVGSFTLLGGWFLACKKNLRVCLFQFQAPPPQRLTEGVTEQ